MKHQLSFGKVNIIDGNIAEIIINDAIELSIEMVEECEEFFTEHFAGSFGILVNKINTYEYTYEAKLTMGASEKLQAIAIVNYNAGGVIQTDRIAKLRATDKLNVKFFSGLELGWQQGLSWLKEELSV